MSDHRQEQELNDEMLQKLYEIYSECGSVLNDQQKALMCYMFGIDAYKTEVAERKAAVERYMKPWEQMLDKLTRIL